MIKTENERLTITLSKKQIQWINEQAKKLHLTASKFISWMLSRKAQEIHEYEKLMNQQIDWIELNQILHTNWID